MAASRSRRTGSFFSGSGRRYAGPVRLADVVATSARVAGSRSRREKVRALAALLRELPPDEVPAAAGFLAGAVRQGRLGLGPAAVRAARPPAPAPAPTLGVLDVDRELSALAELAGPGARAARHEHLTRLLAAATLDEERFLARLVLGELRQGANEGLLAEAVAAAAGLPPDDVRRAAMLAGELPAVAAVALADGAAGLARFRLRLLHPVQPMLAASASDPAEALARLGTAAFEWKLDGARVQVHRQGEVVRVFTRSGNDVTAALPEVRALALALPVASAVLDGEVLALLPDGRPRPFQETMRRFGRRLDVERHAAELPLATFLFDVLHADGADVLDRGGAERRRLLEQLAPASVLVPRAVTADPAEAAELLERALERGHEGLVAKDLEAPYQAGRRGAGWIKLKRAHALDLVVLAAEWGSGRRRGKLSNLHLGARDLASGGFVMLGKTFKGLTDELLAWQTRRLLELEVAREGHVVHVRPELVVEVAFDGVQASPQYPGGVALRFARVRRYRPDKRAAEADTLDAVRALAP